MAVDTRISQANGRLKSAKVGVKIEMIGDRLYLRATLPPKPNSLKHEAYQQRIALGVRANPVGIKEAEAEARKIGALLDCREFEWSGYLNETSAAMTAGDWVSKFEVDYFTRRERNSKSQSTWRKNYWEALQRLPMDMPLTDEVLYKTVVLTTPDTRTRQIYCMALGALAKFVGLEINLRKYSGTYSPKKVTPRDLPSDQEIVDGFFKIANRQWRCVYGLMAVYGLRNHEVFHLDFSTLPILQVLEETKTGRRRVWACYPEWVDLFDLNNVELPNITGKTNSDLGSKVSRFFKSAGVVTPYTLRHCWAVRTLEFGLPVELAAMQMGHSVQVHTDIYHHWISDRHHQRAYDAIMSRTDRPQAPMRSPEHSKDSSA
jgi:integrase